MRALLDTNILVDHPRGIPVAREEFARHVEPSISAVTGWKCWSGREMTSRLFPAEHPVVRVPYSI